MEQRTHGDNDDIDNDDVDYVNDDNDDDEVKKIRVGEGGGPVQGVWLQLRGVKGH